MQYTLWKKEILDPYKLMKVGEFHYFSGEVRLVFTFTIKILTNVVKNDSRQNSFLFGCVTQNKKLQFELFLGYLTTTTATTILLLLL